MPQVLFPCCDVGACMESPEQGYLEADCWMCGSPEFRFVTDMDEWNDPYKFHHTFTYILGRLTRPTGAVPPWRV